MLEIVLAALVGAVFGLGVRTAEDWRDRRRRRRSLATALLVELQSLEIAIRSLAQQNDPIADGYRPLPFFFGRIRSGDLPDVNLFKPQTMYELMKFGGYVREAQNRFDLASGGSDKVSLEKVRDQGAFAAARVSLVKTALLKEGAVEPADTLPEFEAWPNAPTLGPATFSRPALQKATLPLPGSKASGDSAAPESS